MARAHLHQLKEQARLDGQDQLVLGGVATRYRRQEGVPNGAGPLHRLLQTGTPPHRAALDPAAAEQRLALWRKVNKEEERSEVSACHMHHNAVGSL